MPRVLSPDRPNSATQKCWGKGRGLTTGLVWGGPVNKELLRLGLLRPLCPGQGIPQRTPESRGKPVQSSLALRFVKDVKKTTRALSLCSEASHGFALTMLDAGGRGGGAEGRAVWERMQLR